MIRTLPTPAFVPFFMIGDGDTLEHVRIAVAHGADALELGVPFSDPVADGPVIQAAHLRSTATFEDCLDVVKQIRSEFPDLPIGMLVYGNIMFATENFHERLAQAGADTVLIPDIPVREATQQNHIDTVFIAPASADEKTLESVGKASKGYIYAVARDGVTGTDKKAIANAEAIQKLKQYGPVLVGFGISTPADVRSIMDAGADGVIVGSATIKAIQENRLAEFVSEMKAQTFRR